FFSSRRRHTRFSRDWSSDVCSSDLGSSLRGRPGRRRSTSLTASPRRYLRTVFLEIFSSLAIARMLIPRRDKILISITASFVSIQGPVLLVHGRPRILNKGGSIVLSEKGQFPMSADSSASHGARRLRYRYSDREMPTSPQARVTLKPCSAMSTSTAWRFACGPTIFGSED